ncbi:Ig-like domain-containing protein, partial [Ignatzschineria cameli]
AKVVIKNNKGQEIATGTVNSDGSFKVNLKNPTDGSDIKVGLVDGAGNKSPEVIKSTPDKVAPDAPTNLSVGSDGKSVSGKGEPDAKVTIKDKNGSTIGTGNVGKDGNFKVGLNKVTDGSSIKVGLTDAAGNKSLEVSLSTPDKTPKPVEPPKQEWVTVTEKVYKGEARQSPSGLIGNNIHKVNLSFVIGSQQQAQNLELKLWTGPNDARHKANIAFYKDGKLYKTTAKFSTGTLLLNVDVLGPGNYKVVYTSDNPINNAAINYSLYEFVTKQVPKPRMASTFALDYEDISDEIALLDEDAYQSLPVNLLDESMEEDSDEHLSVNKDNSLIDDLYEDDLIFDQTEESPLITEDEIALDELLDLEDREFVSVEDSEIEDQLDLEDLILLEDTEDDVLLENLITQEEEADEVLEGEELDEEESENSVATANEFDVQPVVDPLDDLLDPNKIII